MLSRSFRRTICSYSAVSSCESIPAALLTASFATRLDRSCSTASKAASNLSKVCRSIPLLLPPNIVMRASTELQRLWIRQEQRRLYIALLSVGGAGSTSQLGQAPIVMRLCACNISGARQAVLGTELFLHPCCPD